MKAAVIVFLILGAIMLAEGFDARPYQRPRVPTGNFPTFPGQGPFNPRPRWPEAYGRGRRSAAYVDDSVDVNADYPLQGRQTHGPWSAVE